MIIMFNNFIDILKDVALSVIPLVVIFIVFQLVSLRLSKQKIKEVLLGIFLTFLGLTFFIYGANMSFIDNGEVIGSVLGVLTNKWILILVSFFLGILVTLTEPAVKILNIEVEEETGGYIKEKMILIFLSFGVGLAVVFSVVRILFGWALWYFLLPLYLIAFIIAKYVNPTFVAIAFDSGGVVTGPMIASFLLSLTLGISSVIEGSNPLIDGFGIVAMVAIVPVITILILGMLYERSKKMGGNR